MISGKTRKDEIRKNMNRFININPKIFFTPLKTYLQAHSEKLTARMYCFYFQLLALYFFPLKKIANWWSFSVDTSFTKSLSASSDFYCTTSWTLFLTFCMFIRIATNFYYIISKAVAKTINPVLFDFYQFIFLSIVYTLLHVSLGKIPI